MSITIDSPLLTFTTADYTAAHLSIVLLADNNYAPLATIDYGGGAFLSIIVDAAASSTSAFSLPITWTQVNAVTSGGRTFTQTVTPESPSTGEFVYNPYTNTVQVYSITPVRSLQVYGTSATILYNPPLLPPPYPQLFTNLPLTGTIQFNRQFEQFPTASFELESTLTKSQLQSVFTPGNELDLYGLPLRINSVSITELPRSIYPDARCKISVFLGCRWQNWIDQPCFLRTNGSNTAPNNTPFQDPDCATDSASSATNPNNSTTIQTLLAKLKIPYVGPNLALVLIPPSTPLAATANPSQLLQERLRVANCFVRWSNSLAVETVSITGVQAWSCSESDILGQIETSYEAIARPNKTRLLQIANLNPLTPDLINFPSTIQPPPTPQLRSESPTALSFEYANVELTGQFSESQQNNQQRTQGNSQPRYVRKPPNRTTRTDGDATADTPLAGVTSVQTMSMCFDIGGQTKTRSFVTEEDGAQITIINEVWGFAFTADSIYNTATDKLSGDPNQLWKCLKKTRTDYTYDDKTGYLLSTVESGYNTVRFKQESADNPETLGLDTSDDDYPLYKFIQIPVCTRTSYQLRIMPDYTIDGLTETYKVCNRDGTSTTQLLLNPDYSPPYYVEIEDTESVAFASYPNPENIGVIPDSEDKLLPDLITGEESGFKAITTIIPAVYEEKFTGSSDNGIPIITQGTQLAPQRYVKYIKKFKAQGAAIATVLEEISTEQGTGNPPQATKRPPRYQKEQDNQNQNKVQTPQQQYRYLLQTQGYTVNDPVGGSESFSLATTLTSALIAARCKLAIENWRVGLSERLQIPGNLSIAEGDRFNYFCNGEYRQRVVLGANTTLNILGVVDGQPRITAVTALTLGPYVTPNLTYSALPVPASPKAPTTNLVFTNVVSDTLGYVIDWSVVRSRRNP